MATYNEPPWILATQVKRSSYHFRLDKLSTPYEACWEMWERRRLNKKRPLPGNPIKRGSVRDAVLRKTRQSCVRRLEFPDDPAIFKRIWKLSRRIVWRALFFKKQ